MKIISKTTNPEKVCYLISQEENLFTLTNYLDERGNATLSMLFDETGMHIRDHLIITEFQEFVVNTQKTNQ